VATKIATILKISDRYPLGHYVSTLGDCGDKNVETDVVLHEYNIPYEAFSAKVNIAD
jgi:exoribonuclease R